ncbi:hypothetical protein Bbelb_424300 [Branchiostoma belcheri]|nr:hypothetical protein Bbelb_424300 [Branchiostoma belcheri]
MNGIFTAASLRAIGFPMEIKARVAESPNTATQFHSLGLKGRMLLWRGGTLKTLAVLLSYGERKLGEAYLQTEHSFLTAMSRRMPEFRKEGIRAEHLTWFVLADQISTEIPSIPGRHGRGDLLRDACCPCESTSSSPAVPFLGSLCNLTHKELQSISDQIVLGWGLRPLGPVYASAIKIPADLSIRIGMTRVETAKKKVQEMKEEKKSQVASTQRKARPGGLENYGRLDCAGCLWPDTNPTDYPQPLQE